MNQKQNLWQIWCEMKCLWQQYLKFFHHIDQLMPFERTIVCHPSSSVTFLALKTVNVILFGADSSLICPHQRAGLPVRLVNVASYVPDWASSKKNIKNVEIAVEWVSHLVSFSSLRAARDKRNAAGEDKLYELTLKWASQLCWKQAVCLGGVRIWVKLQLCITAVCHRFDSEANEKSSFQRMSQKSHTWELTASSLHGC